MPALTNSNRPLWSSTKGEVRLQKRASDVLVFVFKGDLGVECVQGFIAAIEHEVASLGAQRPRLFLDLEDVHSYSPGFRMRLGEWHREHEHRLGATHVVFWPETRAVAGVASTLDLRLGDTCQVAPDRRAFEDEVQRASKAPGAAVGSDGQGEGPTRPAPLPLEGHALQAETSLLTIYWLADVQAGYGVWTGLPNLSAVRDALGLVETLLRSHGAGRWISNTEAILVSPPETQTYIVGWLRHMHAERGLR
ncbi:MAG TPA: hypothetical protein VFS00_19230, partial [Polyangiaceae bacterium]|nr:hypothetical protein [Polyangiaceae bacterium]